MSGVEERPHALPLPRCHLAPFILNVGRGIALFFASFAMLNLAGELFHEGFDASVWWIDVRGLPKWVSRGLMLTFSVLLFHFASKTPASGAMSSLRKLAVLAPLFIAVRDALTFRTLLSRDVIASNFPLPFSLVVVVLLLTVLVAMQLRTGSEQKLLRSWGVTAAAALFCLVTFPLLQIYCFGWTDYRRPADAAVVFGCRVYSSGKLSAALADRVRSAFDLYHEGLVSHLIMSGGPGPGEIHETDAMRDFAVSLGVPSDCILIDRMGISTDETVTNTVPLLRKHGFSRVLAVSHFFHLPRIKLTYQRAGVDVFTVPAQQQFRLPNEKAMLVREVAALWAYYARPLTGL